MSVKRTTVWSTIVYPESAPSTWRDDLRQYRIKTLISPLHDRDVDETGNLKKAHYHVVLYFESLKSKSQAEEIFKSINGVGAEDIKSPHGYTQYLCHSESDDKIVYDKNDVVELNGANYELLSEAEDSKYKLASEMIDYCTENNVVSFAELSLYAKNNRFDWFKLLNDNGHFMSQFLKSYNWTLMQEKK